MENKIDIGLDEKLNLILEKLEELATKNISLEQPYESNTTAKLNEAAAQASLEFPKIIINRQNPYLASGYSDIHEILTKIRPVLGKFGLHLAQRIKLNDGINILTTRLWHASGEWIESRVIINPSKNTVESYGSNLNSMKRFEIMNILGLTVSQDPFDDDGEADMDEAHEVMEKGAKLKTLYDKKQESYEVISANEYGELMTELDDQEDLTVEILDNLHLRSLRELPKSRFQPTINRIRKIKKIRTTG